MRCHLCAESIQSASVTGLDLVLDTQPKRKLNILLTADPELPVPPKLYGGIERVIDLLVNEYVAAGHKVGLVAHAESTSKASVLYAWPSESSQDHWSNMRALSKAATHFQPDIVHSFSRLLWLLPLIGRRCPKLMSYQREPTGRTVCISNFLHRGALHFTGCSEYICTNGRSRGGGDWTAIHNAVDATAYQAQLVVADDAPLVFLSRIEPIKGCHNAIEIAKRTGRRLIIAGNHFEDGEFGDYWRAKILPEIGRNRIEYVGPVDDVQKNELLGQAAAMVVPIEWNEPFGIVFAEALACGTPVISSPRGSLPEIIEQGKHGFLVNNVDEGVAAIGKINLIDRSVCRKHFEEKFSSSVISQKYVKLYLNLIDGN